MGRYFDYNDWKIEEISYSIRETLEEARKPLPPKVMKHFITIRCKIGENCYSWGSISWMLEHDEFKTLDDAINFINGQSWLEKIGDNMWVDRCYNETYIDKDGNKVPYHYEIFEYDSEVYADGEYHTEYTKDEIDDLSDALYCIEKARVYMREYDRASNNGSLGYGSFHTSLKEEMNKFEKEYTESLPCDYYTEE